MLLFIDNNQVCSNLMMGNVLDFCLCVITNNADHKYLRKSHKPTIKIWEKLNCTRNANLENICCYRTHFHHILEGSYIGQAF